MEQDFNTAPRGFRTLLWCNGRISRLESRDIAVCMS